MSCPPRHCAISGLDHFLFWPGINRKEKWDQIMNSDYDRTAQQWSCIKRTMEEIKLVAFFPLTKFERSKWRIFSGRHWHSLCRKLVQPGHWVARINVNHKFTTRTN